MFNFWLIQPSPFAVFPDLQFNFYHYWRSFAVNSNFDASGSLKRKYFFVYSVCSVVNILLHSVLKMYLLEKG